MSSFKKLVEEGYQGFMSSLMLTARYGEDLPLHVKVLLHKVDKHATLGNSRSMAMYIAMFLKDYPEENLPPRIVAACKAAKLKKAGIMVGYPHNDGTYHWFGGR